MMPLAELKMAEYGTYPKTVRRQRRTCYEDVPLGMESQ
jgi:hypothetical protein